MMKKKAMTNKQAGGLPIVPQGYKNGGMVKKPMGYMDGGVVSASTQMSGFRSPNECTYQNGPVRSVQDYKK